MKVSAREFINTHFAKCNAEKQYLPRATESSSHSEATLYPLHILDYARSPCVYLFIQPPKEKASTICIFNRN